VINNVCDSHVYFLYYLFSEILMFIWAFMVLDSNFLPSWMCGKVVFSIYFFVV